MTEKENLSCDIAVVGSGVSGLTAAVQAALLGKKVILLETDHRVGGNWDATYGLMAVDSPLSREQGIHVDARVLANQELRLFNYQVDSKLWMDIANASGENIAWLMEQGVEFYPKLEPYTAGEINAPVFHRWKGSAVKKMRQSFENAGGIILTDTRATSIVLKDEKVSGIVAETKDKEKLSIECPAVISAGGGYAKNKEMVAKTIARTDYACRAVASNDGSAIQMCIDAGAKSLLALGNQIIDLIPCKMTSVNHWLTYVHSRPGTFPFHVFVNQDGERYVDEACSLKLFAFAPAAAYTQEKTFTIYDENMLKKLQELNDNKVFDILKHAADTGTEGICRADTFEELAEKLGLDPQRFKETMELYNQYCESGRDLDYEKTPEFLQKFGPGPYYGWENSYQIASTIGGIDYNRKMEVLSPEHKVIRGLYVAGVDGAKIYRDYYSLAIPGSCNANNIYSGRTAARNAVAYLNAI